MIQSRSTNIAEVKRWRRLVGVHLESICVPIREEAGYLVYCQSLLSKAN